MDKSTKLANFRPPDKNIIKLQFIKITSSSSIIEFIYLVTFMILLSTKSSDGVMALANNNGQLITSPSQLQLPVIAPIKSSDPQQALTIINQPQQQQQQQQQHQQTQIQRPMMNPLHMVSSLLHRRPRPHQGQKKPDSSSSFFAPIEDLNDSSIRMKGTIIDGESAIAMRQESQDKHDRQIGAQPLGPAPPPPSSQQHPQIITQEMIEDQLDDEKPKGPARSPDQMHQDFDQLLTRILSPILLQVDKSNGHISHVTDASASADPNHRTTMRFFRNSKTFASIVYMNANTPDGQGLSMEGKRKLINCHLVDLERHATDVALFEAKYNIKTIDIEFRDMMRLIDACTDIARFRTHPKYASGPGANNKQLPGPHFVLTNPYTSVKGAASVPVSPLLGHQIQNQQQQEVMQTNRGHMGEIQTIMTSASNRELEQLPPVADDSDRLDLPGFAHERNVNSPTGSIQRRQLPATAADDDESLVIDDPKLRIVDDIDPDGLETIDVAELVMQKEPKALLKDGKPAKGKLFVNGTTRFTMVPNRIRRVAKRARRRIDTATTSAASNAHQLINVAISRVQDMTATKKLILGEVTPPPKSIETRPGGGLREAIQEISSYDSTDLMAVWRGILPGTNWCGMGDRATSYNDLGFESDIDICCRAHDFCPIRLSAFTSGYGLMNWSFYTRSHCACDQNFLDCLQRAESPLSSVVMKFYFNIMKTTCLNDNETNPSDTTPPYVAPVEQQQLYDLRATGGDQQQAQQPQDQMQYTMMMITQQQAPINADIRPISPEQTSSSQISMQQQQQTALVQNQQPPALPQTLASVGSSNGNNNEAILTKTTQPAVSTSRQSKFQLFNNLWSNLSPIPALKQSQLLQTSLESNKVRQHATTSNHVPQFWTNGGGGSGAGPIPAGAVARALTASTINNNNNLMTMPMPIQVRY